MTGYPDPPKPAFWVVALGTALIIGAVMLVLGGIVGYALMVHYVNAAQDRVTALQATQVRTQALAAVKASKPLCSALKAVDQVRLKTRIIDAHQRTYGHLFAVAFNQVYLQSHCPQILNGTYRVP